MEFIFNKSQIEILKEIKKLKKLKPKIIFLKFDLLLNQRRETNSISETSEGFFFGNV
tara:strand:- start:148 stop:318 length:171 start_codon:yes stop_codon:yes gene_type:complete